MICIFAGALSICWSLLCIARFSSAQIYRGRGSVPISASTVDSWARSFGSELYATASQATQAEGLEKKYQEHNVHVEMFDPEEVIEIMKSRLEAFLGRRRQLAEVSCQFFTLRVNTPRVNDLQILKESLENSYNVFHEVDRSVINDLTSKDFYRFVNAKSCLNRHHIDPLLVNSSLDIQYTPNPNFLNLPVNIEKSAVHVPTPVYSREPELLSEIIWTESLDEIFKARRAREFFAASWQYFCSQRGFMRFYPASPWFYDDAQTCLDMYDCRNSEWYIDAATHAKNIVILLDVSGSMLGQRYEIAKQTIEMIMETLTENDFFNILAFSDEPRFVLPCFRGRLVQATIRNKKLLRAKLDNITSEGIANYPAALKMAFEVVIEARETQKSAGCHSAIMLITDGATDTYEDIFNHYNKDKSIRFFSYLIGDDVTEFREVRWMACYNRGYFAHISNLADVQEKVQSYITIMSRPVAERNHTQPVWTGAYFDQLGHILVATVAFPVIANESFRGVVGASALITELQQMAPSYMLGANAYSFIVDNNGYVVHHPQLRSLHMGKPKPHYNSMDIMELEVLADNALDNGTVETPVDYDNQLRRYLADGISSKGLQAKMSQNVLMAMDGADSLRRVYTQKNVYFHRGIKNTLMTLALAVPEEAVYRIETPNGDASPYQRINFNWFRGKNWKLHPDWFVSIFAKVLAITSATTLRHYCRLNDSDTGMTKEEAFVIYMRQHCRKHADVCLYLGAQFEYLIHRLLLDMEVTSDMEFLWAQKGQIDQSKGIHMVFLATHSGLTRFLTTDLDDILYQPEMDEEANNTDSAEIIMSNKYLYVPFATRYPRALDEVFYKRALQFVNGEFVFDVKTDQYLYIRNGSQRYPMAKDRKTLIVSAARAVFARDGRGHTAPASVVGIEMLYTSFEEMMYNASQRLCRPRSSVRCYLLDEHGYVVYASIPAGSDESFRYLGEFFGGLKVEAPVNGAIERFLMRQMVDKFVYRELLYVDFQELCLNLNLYSSAERLLTVDKLFSAIDFTAAQLFQPFLLVARLLVWIARSFVHFVIELKPWIALFAMFRSVSPYTPTFRDTQEGLPCDKASSFYLLNNGFRGPVMLAQGKQMCSSSIVGDSFAQVVYCNLHAYVTRIQRTNMVLLVYSSDGNQCDDELCKQYFSAHSVPWGFHLVYNASDKVIHPSKCMLTSRYRRSPSVCYTVEDDVYNEGTNKSCLLRFNSFQDPLAPCSACCACVNTLLLVISFMFAFCAFK
ncbi:cache domain protein [Trichuris suis]|nr:cache domain protein [Trichuris suis]